MKARSSPVITSNSHVVPVSIAVILLAHLALSFFPSVRTWGIDYWSEIPVWARALVFGLAVLCLIPRIGDAVASITKGWRPQKWQLPVVLLGLCVLFIVFRSAAFSYGDGYSFRGYFLGGALPSLTGHLRVMTGDVLAHWALIRVTGISADMAYALISALCGVLSILAIIRISRHFFPDDLQARGVVIAAGCSSAMVALWFGYVEAYGLVNASLLWTLVFLIEGRPSLAWASWLAALFFHLLALAFLPLLLIATLGRKAVERDYSRAIFWMLFVIGFLLCGVATFIASQFVDDIFVPIVVTAQSAYTAFSVEHLLDILNLLVFAAPLGLLALFITAGSGRGAKSEPARVALGILALASASLVYFAFWIDPLIGMFRDWDLLGAFGIPLSLFGGILLARRFGRTIRWLTVGGLVLAHVLVFVASLQSESKAMLRVDRMVREDIHYSKVFHLGERRTAWAFVTAHIGELYEISLDHLGRRFEWQPRDMQVSRNMAGIYWELGKLDSALYHFEIAARLNPGDSAILNQLGLTHLRMRHWRETVETYTKLATLRPLSPEDLNRVAFAQLSLDEVLPAETLLAASMRLDPDQQEAYYYRGTMAEKRGDAAAAVADYERAIGPGTTVEDVYSRATRLYNMLVRWDDMARIARQWAGQFPQSATAHFMLGLGYAGLEQHQEANDAYLRAIRLAPSSAMAHLGAGVSYRHLGEPSKALQAVQRAASLDSTLALPYLEMVYLAADAEDRPAAVAATREFLRRSPGDSVIEYLSQFREP